MDTNRAHLMIAGLWIAANFVAAQDHIIQTPPENALFQDTVQCVVEDGPHEPDLSQGGVNLRVPAQSSKWSVTVDRRPENDYAIKVAREHRARRDKTE